MLHFFPIFTKFTSALITELNQIFELSSISTSPTITTPLATKTVFLPLETYL